MQIVANAANEEQATQGTLTSFQLHTLRFKKTNYKLIMQPLLESHYKCHRTSG